MELKSFGALIGTPFCGIKAESGRIRKRGFMSLVCVREKKTALPAPTKTTDPLRHEEEGGKKSGQSPAQGMLLMTLQGNSRSARANSEKSSDRGWKRKAANWRIEGTRRLSFGALPRGKRKRNLGNRRFPKRHGERAPFDEKKKSPIEGVGI